MFFASEINIPVKKCPGCESMNPANNTFCRDCRLTFDPVSLPYMYFFLNLIQNSVYFLYFSFVYESSMSRAGSLSISRGSSLGFHDVRLIESFVSENPIYQKGVGQIFFENLVFFHFFYKSCFKYSFTGQNLFFTILRHSK